MSIEVMGRGAVGQSLRPPPVPADKQPSLSANNANTALATLANIGIHHDYWKAMESTLAFCFLSTTSPEQRNHTAVLDHSTDT
jgi:hypothetical protein